MVIHANGYFLLWSASLHDLSCSGEAVILEWSILRACKIKGLNLSLLRFLSLSALYFCNWKCHNKINSVVITDFTSCYWFPLEEAATRTHLKIFLFHASSISSLYERWTSGWICCFRLMSVDRAASCLWHAAFHLLCNSTFAGMGKAILYHSVKQDKAWKRMEVVQIIVDKQKIQICLYNIIFLLVFHFRITSVMYGLFKDPG